ncbi:MAG: DUF1211 domain-containing protein [Bacteroidetes bacterium]|nr:DUF1211 domain-containing protein [Bacteroidota bacterium]
MFRKKAAAKKRGDDYIRRRGQEVTRIEAFSDAVFAFGVTLLIVSLEVPHDYREFIHKMILFIPFGISFFIVFSIWYQQNVFFRRYGLHDIITIRLNAVLLFLVLAYMFPLKFLFSSMFSTEMHLESGQTSTIFCLYAGGFACFYFLFAWMYQHAYNLKDKIRLTEIEIFQTKTHIYNYLIVACVSAFGVLLASFGDIMVPFAGLNFWMIFVFTYLLNKKRKKIFKERFGDVEHEPVDVHMHAHHIPDEEMN